MNGNSENSVGHPSQAMQDETQGEQQPLQAPAQGGQYPCGGDTANAAPAAPQPERWANIPAALRERPQWVLAGADKRPLTADCRAASSTDPATWCDFDTASRAAQAKGLHIGYMLHEGDPFTCIDLDVKDTTPQEHVERFNRIVTAFDSYTERSRSGKGFHVWVEGRVGKGRKRDGVEVYSQERFIICTGDTVSAKPIAARPDLLSTLVAEMQEPAPAPDVELDGELVPDFGLATRAALGDGELGRLFNGDWEGRYPSQSEADLALVKLLLPLTESREECWGTFRMSALDKRDKAKRWDYAGRTLAQAAQHLGNDAAQAAHGKAIADSLFWRNPSTHHFRLLSDADLQNLPRQRWLVKRVIPEGGVGTMFGQSGTFKSFLALDLMAHVANGWQWFGHRVKAAPAVYVPFEGRGGIPKRVKAWKLARDRQHDVPMNMQFITDPMNLRNQADRDKLVRTLVDHGWAGGLLCIDTLAQAGVGIDENSSEGMGEMIAIFQELQHRLGGTVLVVHHSGKVESAGMRGWSGLRAALDFSIKCQKEEGKGASKFNAQFVLDKVKDDEDGKTFGFSMLRVHLGHDEDGEEETSMTVIPRIATQEVRPSDAERDAEDDKFVWEWVKREVAAGEYPTGRSLEGQRELQMKQTRDLTQKRLRDAIHRLRASSMLVDDDQKSPSGNTWMRAV